MPTKRTHVLETCEIVLEMRSQLVEWNPLRLARVYEDERVRVVGVLDADNKKYEFIYVLLKGVYGERAHTQLVTPEGIPFTPPKADTEGVTLVYLWEPEPTLYENGSFQRNGLWKQYLTQLRNRLEGVFDVHRRYNDWEIDDAELFAGLNL